MELGIAGKVIVVTGGGSGHGATMAEALAREGAVVAVADLDGESARMVCERIASSGGRCAAYQIDITHPEVVETMMQDVAHRFGALDVLVNNACAPIRRVPFSQMDLAEWLRVIEVNLTGTFICSQSAARIMLKQKAGRMINISSFSANVPAAGFAAYSASKAGIEALSRTVAGELGKSGISTVFVRPGVMETERTKPQHEGAVGERMRAPIAIDRFGTSGELANLIVFLASDAASYINGGPIPIDGGKYAIQL